jgi:hypothetical protein
MFVEFITPIFGEDISNDMLFQQEDTPSGPLG